MYVKSILYVVLILDRAYLLAADYPEHLGFLIMDIRNNIWSLNSYDIIQVDGRFNNLLIWYMDTIRAGLVQWLQMFRSKSLITSRPRHSLWHHYNDGHDCQTKRVLLLSLIFLYSWYIFIKKNQCSTTYENLTLIDDCMMACFWFTLRIISSVYGTTLLDMKSIPSQ